MNNKYKGGFSMDPYKNKDVSEWQSITEKLIKEHPLSQKEIVEAVLISWDEIFDTLIGNVLKIGRDIKPSPQILGIIYMN